MIINRNYLIFIKIINAVKMASYKSDINYNTGKEITSNCPLTG